MYTRYEADGYEFTSESSYYKYLYDSHPDNCYGWGGPHPSSYGAKEIDKSETNNSHNSYDHSPYRNEKGYKNKKTYRNKMIGKEVELECFKSLPKKPDIIANLIERLHNIKIEINRIQEELKNV